MTCLLLAEWDDDVSSYKIDIVLNVALFRPTLEEYKKIIGRVIDIVT